jgi:DNA-binding MarR family transcriptional regulator
MVPGPQDKDDPMTKLSDTQAILLSAAAQRADGNLLPLPGSLRGGAAVKVVGALLTRGLAREDVTDLQTRADRALNTVWRNEDDGRAVLLRITPAGLEAIGVESDAAAASEPVAEPAAAEAKKKRGRPKKAAATSKSAPTAAPRKSRADTKQAQVIAMLRRKQGATIAQIVEASAWRPHTVRGFFAGALKKKLGLTVTSEKVEGKDRVYRLC